MQLTLRYEDPELEQRVRLLARRERISLNQAVVRLLRKATGLDGSAVEAGVGTRLDHLAGTWTPEEHAEFERAIAPLDVIDQELWR